MSIRIQHNPGNPAEGTNRKEVHSKALRNKYLAQSDIYMIEDYPTDKKTEWKTYRKELRDMDFSDLDNLKWPTKPE